MTLQDALGIATDTDCFLTGEVIERSAEIYERYFGHAAAFIVADENTYDAAGLRAGRAFAEAGIPLKEPLVFPGSPALSADYGNTQAVREAVELCGANPVAVGSGTVNDLVKVAAFESGRRYMCIATAASVDGYTAPGASILKDGFKNTIFCRAPQAVIADTRVLQSAPGAMSAAGYADLAGKYTAGADWIIADLLGVEPIDPVAWEMVHDDLDNWLDDPSGVAAKNKKAHEKLFYGLTMTGLAMQYTNLSRPASGFEHMMSHIWEMEGLKHQGKPVSHGFKVALGTLGSLALTELVFTRSPESLRKTARERWIALDTVTAEIRRSFDSRLHDAIIKESSAKFLSREEHARRYDIITARWDEIRGGVFRRLPAYGEMRGRLAAVGAPVVPEEIGLTRARVGETYKKASFIRNRYTIVDLAIELGILDECVEEILDSDVYLR